MSALACFITLDDIQQATEKPDPAHETPILNLVDQARAKGYDTICLPLTSASWKKRWREMCLLPSGQDREPDSLAERKAEDWRASPAFLRDEVTVNRLDEASNVIALASAWLELDAEDDWVRHDSEIALQQELAYASYLNIHTVVVPAPRSRAHVASYARAINACLANVPYVHLSVRLPIFDVSVVHKDGKLPGSASSTPQVGQTQFNHATIHSSPLAEDSTAKAPQSAELKSNWEMWDIIRSMCDYNTRLNLTLDLTLPLPSSLGVLNRWAGEPVRYIFLPASTFIANAKGYPVLPKGTQSFIRDVMRHHPTVILGNAGGGVHARGGEPAYAQYVRHLEKTSPAVMAAKTAGTVENFAQGYQDYLQSPLQPLMDNLQSVTYQTFEQDPVKYRELRGGGSQFIKLWSTGLQVTSSSFVWQVRGRGPLVARCLKAMERAKREAVVYALEKNPNAFVTLQNRVENEWAGAVQLFFGDMRAIEVPEKVDILVSELLGSFGDNELSPECLDGAMRLLKPTGISIPSSYTAYLAPLSSSKLFSEARAGKDVKGSETPYVVMLQAVNILSGDGGGVGDIVVDRRGLPLTNSHNVRSAKLTYHIPHAGVLHGLAGYFEAVLYPGVDLSIHPHRKDRSSKDMLSWFPLFFPFRDPLYLPSNSELQVSIWRLTNRRQVWYEWCAESFLPVHAPVAEVVTTTTTTPTPSGAMTPVERFSRRPSLATKLLAVSMSPSVSSPLVDAVDAFPLLVDTGKDEVRPHEGVVKIGQTALHNPGGRSSWIGLVADVKDLFSLMTAQDDMSDSIILPMPRS